MARMRGVWALMLVVGSGGWAFGQDALGDGRALDNNLSTQSRYNAQRPSLAQELRFRNAIVTGNAPNGLSFRGDVGYRAPGEFTGVLGSNDLFAFRRDSLYSGLAGMGIRGAEALQLQFSMTTGGAPPRNVIGSMTLPRDIPQNYTTGRVPDSIRSMPTVQHAPPELDQSEGTMMGSLRSSAAFESNRGYQPMLLLWGQDEESEKWFGVTASELRGVRRTELKDQSAPSGRVDTSIEPERFETSFDAISARIQAEAEKLATPSAEAETDKRSPWEVRLDELRNELLAKPESDESEEEPETPTNPDGSAGFDPDTLRILRGVTGEVSRDFVPPDAHGVYAEHMRRGQELLEKGMYFDAEERFSSALTIRPNDVPAQVGRIHAQIGAGMFLSAALNLRTLMVQRPEVIASRYDEKLMPSSDRLGDVIETLRAGIAKTTVESPAAGDLRRGRAAGLLLAYIGIQTGNGDLVAEGVAAGRYAIDRSRLDGTDRENDSERRLFDLIESIWMKSQNP